MTEPSEPSDEQTEFTPLTVEEMFSETKRKPGRLSAADRTAQEELAQRRLVAYETLLVSYNDNAAQVRELRARNSTLEASARYWQDAFRNNSQTVFDTNNKRVTDLAHATLALKVFAELAFLMSDTECQPSVTRDWNDVETIKFTNKYGTFQLVFGDKPKLSIIPKDKTRREISFELDKLGLTPTTVLMIKGHLGLPDDGQLPKRAEDVLRRKPPTPQEIVAGAKGMFGLDDDYSYCGNPDCPIHGNRSSGIAAIFTARPPFDR